MEEMKFLRKLMEEEKKEWKGLVYYVVYYVVVCLEKKIILIRIVFNSLVFFKGYSLNDYWYKGFDLLNNLFGVVLWFRENVVVVCGDIMKMYYMVVILLVD